MSDYKQIHWYPGHMAKTKRIIGESLKLVDIVLEVLDARIPESSRNPDIDELLTSKPRIILLNKSDMSDPEYNRKWQEYYERFGHCTVLTDSAHGAGIDGIVPAAKGILKEKLYRDAQKGVKKAVKIMVVGVPNVGKSSFINRFVKSKKSKVEDRPGVTRDKHWIRPGNGIELLDTPGVLWPRFDNPETAQNLAFTGAVKDDVMEQQEISVLLLEKLALLYPGVIFSKYKAEESEDGFAVLCSIAKSRGLLIRGGEPDLERASTLLLHDFRNAAIGKITLERPA